MAKAPRSFGAGGVAQAPPLMDPGDVNLAYRLMWARNPFPGELLASKSPLSYKIAEAVGRGVSLDGSATSSWCNSARLGMGSPSRYG